VYWIAKRGVQRGVLSEEKSGLGSPTVCFVSQDQGKIFGSRNLPAIPAVVTENSVRAENAVVPSIREILVVSR
jgi:hypothetical protein